MKPHSLFRNHGVRTRILICGPNWIGDTIMSMPAVQALRRNEPQAIIAILVKPHIAPLWRMHAAPDLVLSLEPGVKGIWRAARRLRRERFDWAYILPHSVRSALPPWLAGMPRRIGFPAALRDLLLHGVVRPFPSSQRKHQVYENMDMLAPAEAGNRVEAPELMFNEERVQAILNTFSWQPQNVVGLIPGAARGPSKRWPPDSFAALGRRLRDDGWDIAIFGGPGESPLCARVAESIDSAVNLAGKTTIEQWAVLLRSCRLVVANDSGGMHLSAAAGAPVIAIFGMTDPGKTAPLATSCLVMQREKPHGRDIPRNSTAARHALESISPDEVYEAACQILQK